MESSIFQTLIIVFQSENNYPKKKFRLQQVYERYFDAYVESSDRTLKLEKKHFTAIRKSSECFTRSNLHPSSFN